MLRLRSLCPILLLYMHTMTIGDALHGLKSSSFSQVLFLPASYAGMRREP
jgi:hypothetical protein